MTYECAKCNIKVLSRCSMIRHIHTAHAEEKKYFCYVCSKLYSRSDVLLRHVTHVHKMHIQNNKPGAQTKSSDKDTQIKSKQNPIKQKTLEKKIDFPSGSNSKIKVEENAQNENIQVNVEEIRKRVVPENPRPTTEASDEINNYEDKSEKTIETSIEEFRNDLEDLPLITESEKVTNNNLDELDEALEILKTVHNMVQTSPLLDNSSEDVEILNIKNDLLSLS